MLQCQKNQTLQRFQLFEASVKLSKEAVPQLDQWGIKRKLVNWKSVMTHGQEPDLTMEMDILMMRQGAVCKGIQTRGLWFLMECKNHINYLAAMFTVKLFAKDSRNAHVTST